MKRIEWLVDGPREVKVFWDRTVQEFVVKLRLNCKAQPAADYHTSDKEDALGTARAMVKPK